MSARRRPARNVVDSSGWLEYLVDGPNAGFFAPALEDTDRLVVPTLSLLEVVRWVLRERGDEAAIRVSALMQQGKVVALTPRLSLLAARLGLAHRLPLADSVILATARHHEAVLWTQDADFDGLEGVRYRKKPGA